MVMVLIYDTPEEAVRATAHTLVHAIGKIMPYRCCEFGAATGNTQKPLYAEMVKLWPSINPRPGRFRTWNLDEYEGLDATNPQSYRYYMYEHLHGPLKIPDHLRRFPCEPPEEYDVAMLRETAAGGIDLGILGIGRTRHIGFCEPGAPRKQKTHRATLHEPTRVDAVREFGSLDLVPTGALTMGVSTIIDLWSRIFLLAFGESKAAPVHDMLEGPIGSQCPASFLREHRDTTIVLDRAAASLLKKPTIYIQV